MAGLNNNDASINVLRLAAEGDLLVLVLVDGHSRDTRLVRVTKRVTSHGRHGSTTITATDITRDNGKSFDLAVTVSKLPENVVAAHTVNVPKGSQLARKQAAQKQAAAKARAAKASATKRAKKASLTVDASALVVAPAVATPENDPCAPAAGDGFAVPASLGGIAEEPAASDVPADFTPGI